MNQEEFVHCTECLNIDHCHDVCHLHEQFVRDTNIAEQRGETPEQLWGDSK
jgi:hypothetical protein